MTRLSRARLGLIIITLAAVLTACGAPPPEGWPGVAANDELAFVAFNQQVHAIRLSDGKEAWAFPPTPSNTSGIFFADPGLGPEVLVVGSEGPASSYSGILYGLEPATGQQKWCLAFDAKGAQRQNCPLAAGAASAGFLGIASPSDNRIIGGVTVADGVAYVGLANARVYAVDVKEGAARWSFAAEQAIWAAPQVEGDAVYVASLDHFVYALNRANGSLKWKKDLGAASAGTPAVADGTLYIGSFGNQLYALDVDTGEEKWPAIKTNHWVWGGPVVQAGVVYFADLSGTVYAVDAKTGVQKWAVTPGGVIRASPAVTAKAVYVGDRSGNLSALDPASGAKLWTQTMKGELLAAPLVVNDKLWMTIYKGDNLLAAYTTAGEPTNLAYAPSK